MNFAMSVAEFDQHKQNAYKAAVAKAAGPLVQFSDIELVIASISSTAQLATANPSRRRLLQDDTVGRRMTEVISWEMRACVLMRLRSYRRRWGEGGFY